MNSWKDFCQILLLWYKGYEYQIFKAMFDFRKFDGKCEGKNRKKKVKEKNRRKIKNRSKINKLFLYHFKSVSLISPII